VFIGREKELDFFNDKYNTPGGQLLILYGRRRVGKTEFLRRFAEGKPHVFYSCRELSDARQLSAFSERILKIGIPAAQYISTFQDWETAFKGITDFPSDGKKKLLIIDEFPYMCKANPSIPSILQILWDELLKNQNIMVILCGSAMSFIEKKILSEKNPLYGRTTGIYKMVELPFDDAVKFFSDYSYEDKILAYAILGGIPHYLLQFDPTLTLKENIIKNVLTKGCVLYNEVEFLIRQELREPALYNTIIQTIAFGNTQLNHIFDKTQIEKSKISVYLNNLIELQILEREFSVLSGSKEQAASTRGLYRIKDKFFRFWYSFVFLNISDLEIGDAEGVYEHVILPDINNFVSPIFEAVCCDFIRKQNQRGLLPFRISELGRWWGKITKEITTDDGKSKLITIDSEIDIVAVNAKYSKYFLGECKYKNTPINTSDFEKLKEKSSIVKKGAMVEYVLFSKSGFSKGLTEFVKESEHIKLYTLVDIIDGK